MIEQKIQFNPAQQIGVLLQAKNKADIWGRGTGKSAGIAWDINLINRTMSRALTAVTGQTFGQLLTRAHFHPLSNYWKLSDTKCTSQPKIPATTSSTADRRIISCNPTKK